MQSEPRQILLLLDSGQITLAEAERLLDSGRLSLNRLQRWISARLGYAIAVAVLAGMLLQPALLLAVQAAFQAVAGSVTLQLFFRRVLEAML